MTIPFFCILAAHLLIYVPHIVAGRGRFKLPGGFDNNRPREQTATLEGGYRRAAAAHQNGFESFAPFAAAVFVAHLAHGAPGVASVLAVAFVVLRAVYIAAYIANLAALRSTVWTLGLGCTAALFLLPLVS